MGKKEANILELGCLLAQNDIEESLSQMLHKKHLVELLKCKSLIEKQFVFRGFQIPEMCLFYMDKKIKDWKGDFPFWLTFFETYVLAHSRLVNEMTMTGRDPSKGWFENPESLEPYMGCSFYLQRFELWMKSLEASYFYFIHQKCPDALHPDPHLAEAAFRGAVENLSGWPEGIIAKLVARYREHGKHLVKKFYDTAANLAPPQRKYLDLDVWLIEIWPIVMQYQWNYRDVWLVAQKKFESEKAVFDSADAMSSRCKSLNLRLSKEAKSKSGRPKNEEDLDEATLPYLSDLALLINGFPTKAGKRDNNLVMVPWIGRKNK